MSLGTKHRSSLLLALAMLVPFLASLLLFAVSLASGKALVFGVLWPLIQIVSYGFLIKRLGFSRQNMPLVAQCAIHWMIAAFVLVLLFGK